ncbi:MAG: RNA methyltransferase [Luteitalea sp.]|nr:RNA methyltransferase [Luteitalea sp.]
MPVVPIESSDDPRIADYRSIPDPELLARRGVFIAEGRLVVRRLLETGSPCVRSLLVSDAALASIRDVVDPDRDSRRIYVASKDLLSAIVGFNVHRGCLACAERPAPLPLETVIAPTGRSPLIVLEAVGNPDNIGGIFRNARALGGCGVVLDRRCCDPLYRKAIRVSMGSCLEVPFTTVDEWIGTLQAIKDAGWWLVGLAPDRAAPDLADVLRGQRAAPVAFLLGHEGFGLSDEARALTHAVARIPMAPGVDSLNIATAAAIALYERRRQRQPR